MTHLYTLAFPRLNQQDRNWIDQVRKRHDPDYRKVQPHFTLLFGCQGVVTDIYIAHVESITKATASFEFHARRVLVGTDYFGPGGYAFLVPDEGQGSVLALHDRLYTGPLSSYLRRDLPYLPHITLGKCRSPQQAQILCDELNSETFSVSGVIDTLTVVEENNGSLKILEQVSLMEEG